MHTEKCVDVVTVKFSVKYLTKLFRYNKKLLGRNYIGLSFLILTSWSVLNAQIPTGEEIIKKVNEIMSPINSKGVMTQTVQTSSGKIRIFEFEMYSTGKGEKSLMRYQKPASVRGQAFLMLNHADDIWTYFPRTKRVRKLATHAKKQKVQGSDFTYEDMGSGGTWEKEFISQNLGEEKWAGELCWKLQMIGITENNPPYPKMIIWVRQSDFYPLFLDYYDDKDRIIKSLVMEDIQLIEGIPTAMIMTMKNNEEGTESIMKTLSVTYSWQPPEGFFSERNLKK